MTDYKKMMAAATVALLLTACTAPDPSLIVDGEPYQNSSSQPTPTFEVWEFEVVPGQWLKCVVHRQGIGEMMSCDFRGIDW